MSRPAAIATAAALLVAAAVGLSACGSSSSSGSTATSTPASTTTPATTTAATTGATSIPVTLTEYKIKPAASSAPAGTEPGCGEDEEGGGTGDRRGAAHE